ncbi:MAG TPA: maltose alpha-D-glucosyltransferase [Acetobacteraceae bacterium]|nr:maltose alpha-D-glucosyltransferase [Acetobacteraceae bacterium]
MNLHSSRPRRKSVADDPLWFKDAVIYQVHVKSYFDANNDGIGDLAGLNEKLDYIAALGANAIWLLPFYPSPRHDDGYDIAEYRAVHPEYGTLRDMRRFLAAAHARGIRVITELVINHTSEAHPWFQRARRARPGTSARKFYVWSDDDRRYSDARIIFLDTEKSNWSFDSVAGAYYWHRFYAHQPDLNFEHPRVLEAVLSVMRFWLDLGVDGFRLDAVPYLVEREGTDCENLLETHAVIKRIRVELTHAAPECVLLAEANQWPEDAQEYFGAGDECHMAFHFPLMPRMYMAIAQEDRFPITDILRQTPEIPASCQWAVFLRNHDELTLEMVTDAERDYLWNTYAADRRARLNLGIRRRLAPLLERDRRRIELMNGLLFSMPGTPVLYYGDEIGMGDNIYLGDRDGVRTPMQWSPDRNGGFSRADPASLVLPPIMDPIYGFEAVNVEAQARDAHSLLNWHRRMLAVRGRHRAFGRGRLRLLYPANRKILAFLREYDVPRDAAGGDGPQEGSGGEAKDETILCVSNLARTAEAVELDLSAFAGRVPVDLLGGSVFPPIGELTYLLTLPPHAFYWFSLERETAMPAWRVPAPEPLPELATLVLRRDIADLAEAEGLRLIEQEILPPYLARRRWFAAKDRKVRRISIARTDILRGGAGDFVSLEIAVTLDDREDRYFLPVGIVWDDQNPGVIVHQLALARVRRHRRTGMLTDAFAIDALPRAVLASLAQGQVVPLADGELRWSRTSQPIPPVPPDVEILRLSAEQSNTSLILGDIAVLKIIRRVSPGLHPQTEMSRHLTERRFGSVPSLLGELVRTDASGTPHTLLIVEQFVRNQGDAWQWTTEVLKRAVGPASLTGTSEEAMEDLFAGYMPLAAAIGRRLGELHAVLAAAPNDPNSDPAFAPELVDEQVAASWAAAAAAELDAACATLSAFTAWRDDDERTAATLIALHDPLRARLATLAAAAPGSLSTRIHGDFHLGQVLVAPGDAVLIDFEGEPAKTLAERRAKGSPFRDVAGLLRSFDYAAGMLAREPAPALEAAAGHRDELLRRFVKSASSRFLVGYRTAAAAAERKWVRNEDAARALTELFLVQKAAYEIGYEAANRPSWIGVPLAGLLRLAQRLLANDAKSPTDVPSVRQPVDA